MFAGEEKRLHVMPMPSGHGSSYMSSPTVPRIRIAADEMKMEPVLHEVGHHIQDRLDMRHSGTNEYRVLEEMVSRKTGSIDPDVMRQYWDSLGDKEREVMNYEAAEGYLKDPGESMSRWTEGRLNLPRDELSNLRPSQTPDPTLATVLEKLKALRSPSP
jgi:hypothetical protein